MIVSKVGKCERMKGRRKTCVLHVDQPTKQTFDRFSLFNFLPPLDPKLGPFVAFFLPDNWQMSNCQFRLFLAFSSLILFLLLICLTEATENVRVQQVVESSPQNVSADSLDCVNDTNAEHISSTTTPAPAPPVVERIEVRLVDGENGTEETPLIIVDVVKKNGSGVAATIQQHQDSLDSKHPRPDQGFLVRLKQPNYHAVSYIPFELSTTTEMPEETTEQSTTAISTSSTTLSNGADETAAVSSSTIISAAEKEKEEANASSNTEADAGNIGIESLGIGEMVQIVMQKKQQLEKMEKQKSREEKIIKNTMPEEEANLPGEQAGEEEAEASRRPTNEQWTDEVEEGGGGESAEVGEEDGSVEEEVEEMESEEALRALEANGTATFGEAADRQQQQFHGDLTEPEDNEQLEEEEEAVGDAENEECLANRNKLPKEMVKRLLAERRRVVQAIKKINKHQMLLCRPDRRHNQVPYRKCPMWRREKFFLYYALMRITYCGNHARWPGGRRFRAL